MTLSLPAPGGPEDAVMLALVAASAFTDLRERRIPNAFTYPALVAGLLLAMTRGPGTVMDRAFAVAAAAAIFAPLCWVGGMGLGDLKLMAAIGALKGLPFTLSVVLDAALAGGAMAVVIIAKHGFDRARFLAVLRLPRSLIESFWGKAVPRLSRPAPGATVPYGAAIAVGCLVAWWTGWPFVP
jgi:prepilin peptidase CpaA